MLGGEGSSIAGNLTSLEGNHYKLILNKSEVELVAQINKLTELFEEAKRERSSSLIDAHTFHRKCEEVLQGYRRIEVGKQAKGRVREFLHSYIVFLE